MGYHQSRWGYKSLAEVEQVVSSFKDYDIPLDAFWFDLDYMKDKMIFTVNEQTYPPSQLNAFFAKENLKLVPLLDVGIATHDHPA